MSLSSKVLSAFATLATPVAPNVFESNEKFGAMFKKGQDEARKEAEKAIVTELAGVATRMGDRKLQLTQTAVALERQAEDAREAVTAIDTAFAYGEKQDNYLPLLHVLGVVGIDDYRSVGVTKAVWEELLTIPEGWTPAAPAAA